MKYLVSESWLYLKPNVDVNYNKEKFEGYYERCKFFFKHIPKEVLEQWIHPFHDNMNTLINYAWIEYWKDNIQFDLIQLAKSEFQKVYATENCFDYYLSRSTFKSWDEIILAEKDLAYWVANGTWSLPPIIMDTETFSKSDNQNTYNGRFQLIEGHTRIGLLNTLVNLGDSSKAQVKELHWVYIMRCITK